MECRCEKITITVNLGNDYELIKCDDCGYIFSIPEFRKREFKEINIIEKRIDRMKI